MNANDESRQPTCEELAAQLKADYDAAGKDSATGIDKVSAVLLFAEKNIAYLNKSNYRKIVDISGLPPASYRAWLVAGMRLAAARAKLGLR